MVEKPRPFGCYQLKFDGSRKIFKVTKECDAEQLWNSADLSSFYIYDIHCSYAIVENVEKFRYDLLRKRHRKDLA